MKFHPGSLGRFLEKKPTIPVVWNGKVMNRARRAPELNYNKGNTPRRIVTKDAFRRVQGMREFSSGKRAVAMEVLRFIRKRADASLEELSILVAKEMAVRGKKVRVVNRTTPSKIVYDVLVSPGTVKSITRRLEAKGVIKSLSSWENKGKKAL